MPRPSNENLAHAFCADLITDARHAYKCARAVDRGAHGYGCSATEYRTYAEQVHASYTALRSATRYHVGTNGEVTAA